MATSRARRAGIRCSDRSGSATRRWSRAATRSDAGAGSRPIATRRRAVRARGSRAPRGPRPGARLRAAPAGRPGEPQRHGRAETSGSRRPRRRAPPRQLDRRSALLDRRAADGRGVRALGHPAGRRLPGRRARAADGSTGAHALERAADGRWVQIEAAPLEGDDAGRVAVTLRGATAAETFELLCRGYALTRRERQVVLGARRGAGHASPCGTPLHLAPHGPGPSQIGVREGRRPQPARARRRLRRRGQRPLSVHPAGRSDWTNRSKLFGIAVACSQTICQRPPRRSHSSLTQAWCVDQELVTQEQIEVHGKRGTRGPVPASRTAIGPDGWKTR